MVPQDPPRRKIERGNLQDLGTTSYKTTQGLASPLR